VKRETNDEADTVAEALRLQGKGLGYRAIADAIGQSRHWVRHRLMLAGMKDRATAPVVIEPPALSRYDAACRALAEAKSLHEVMEIADKSTALKEYYRRAKDRTAEAHMAELRVLAERRWGQMFGELKAAGLVAKAAPGNQYTGPVLQENRSIVTLAYLGADKKFSVRAQRLASISDRALQAQLAGWRTRIERGAGRVTTDILKAHQQEQRRAAHAVSTFGGGSVDDLHRLAASGFRAATILADPPWKFITHSKRGEGRSANQHYRTDTLELIKALPAAQLAAPHAALFMWMVDWCPDAALEVIKAWGFEHKTTAFTWAKQHESGEGWHMGQGYWTRANPEACWLATRGNPKRLYADVRQLIVAPVMEHSRKPDEAHDRIERLTEGPYLELYARRERRAWMTWGDEIAFKVPHAISGDPKSGDIKEPCVSSDPPGFVSAPLFIEHDGLTLPAFLQRGHPECVVGGGK
jgi:N6-adenosine-specific RNA methylase IME4